MKLAQEEKDSIISYAELFFTPQEIARNLEIPYDVFESELMDHDSEISKAVFTGKLQGEYKLRTAIMNMADHGSHPAQQLMLKIKEESEVIFKDRCLKLHLKISITTVS